MSEDLLHASGALFTTGSAHYLDARPGSRESLARVYVEFEPAGAGRSLVALLDTGAHYCILHPDVAEVVADHLIGRLTEAELRTAHGTFRGELYVHRITLLAQHGESLDVDVTVFIAPEWQGPNFIGYTGALDRLRFAIDPGANRFYFGPLK